MNPWSKPLTEVLSSIFFSCQNSRFFSKVNILKYLLTFLLLDFPHLGSHCFLSLASHRHITDSAPGEENVSLSASLVGDWRQSTLALPWVEPVHHLCKEFTVPDKRNWQSLPLSALQILEIAIKHLDKISRWRQGERMISHRRRWSLWTLLMAWTLLSPGTVWSWVSFLEELYSLARWQEQTQITLWIGESRGKLRPACLKVCSSQW